MTSQRLKTLSGKVEEQNIGALMLSSEVSMQYASGFAGEGCLLLTPDSALLVTDFRYVEQARQQAPEVEIVQCVHSVAEKVKEIAAGRGIHRLGFETDALTFEQYRDYQERLQGVELVPVSGLVQGLRMRKEPGEVKIIKEAVRIADEGFEHLLGILKPGMRENEVAAELEYFFRRKGAEGVSFTTIIASGFRGALPHGTASGKKLAAGELLVLDFGARYNGYCSDMTRTVVFGEPTEEQAKVYGIVLEAQQKAENVVKAGMECSAVDKVARDIIADRGYGDNFGHGLGHGVGMEIHEKPSLNRENHELLEPGMVITVEPGIYINKWGGVRIEDMVLVTKDGHEVLTQSPKQLIKL